MTKEEYTYKRIHDLGDDYKSHSTSKTDWDKCIAMECGDWPSFGERTSAELTLKMLLKCRYTIEQMVDVLDFEFPNNNNSARPRRVFNCFSGGKCRNIEEYKENGKLGLLWDRYKFFTEDGKWKAND